VTGVQTCALPIWGGAAGNGAVLWGEGHARRGGGGAVSHQI